ncbi:MAG: ATP-grasp domain-containing protein [Deltaproteobacteria bacterium]|nr:MAG: ATP-grasp domain-containing protein [Deltaproteobacteria bacterium]
MKKLRVVVLMHEDLIPPDSLDGYSEIEINEWKTEYDVVSALEELGHDVLKLGVRDELGPLRAAIDNFKPDIVFNLLEEFRGEAVYDLNVIAYLELRGVAYTGCGPRGLLLARDKSLSKQLLSYHRIRVPRFVVCRIGRKIRRPRGLDFPLIVKSLTEDSSMGISQASVVHDDATLAERVAFVHDRIKTDAIVEQFIDGRELYVSVLGNTRLTVLPVAELVFRRKPPDGILIATTAAKHDVAYQERWGVDVKRARGLPAEVEQKLARIGKRIYRILGLTGYGRIDFRLSREGEPYFLEANPNPEIARYEEFASAADAAGMTYEQLLERILRLGLQRTY